MRIFFFSQDSPMFKVKSKITYKAQLCKAEFSQLLVHLNTSLKKEGDITLLEPARLPVIGGEIDFACGNNLKKNKYFSAKSGSWTSQFCFHRW